MEIFFRCVGIAFLLLVSIAAIAAVVAVVFSFWIRFWVIPLIQKMTPPRLDEDEK